MSGPTVESVRTSSDDYGFGCCFCGKTDVHLCIRYDGRVERMELTLQKYSHMNDPKPFAVVTGWSLITLGDNDVDISLDGHGEVRVAEVARIISAAVAKRERKAVARALREAADALHAMSGSESFDLGGEEPKWLRACAERAEKGET